MPPTAPDWSDVFAPSTPILETVIRGTLTYLFLLGLLRFAHKRQAGTGRSRPQTSELASHMHD